VHDRIPEPASGETIHDGEDEEKENVYRGKGGERKERKWNAEEDDGFIGQFVQVTK